MSIHIFGRGRIVIRRVRRLSPCFNAALVVSSRSAGTTAQTRTGFAPPNPYASSVEDWPRMISRRWRTEGRWLLEPDLSVWVAGSRLNLVRALPDHAAEPSVHTAVTRYLKHVTTAIGRLGSSSDELTRV
jgi:hypothetical protein